MTLDEIVGGAPYGATTIAGARVSEQPTKLELEGAGMQGELIAKVARRALGIVLARRPPAYSAVRIQQGNDKWVSFSPARPTAGYPGAIPHHTCFSVLRIAAGLMFSSTEPQAHRLPGGALSFHRQDAMGLLYFTGTMELVGGALIVLARISRRSPCILSGFMAFGFMAHFP